MRNTVEGCSTSGIEFLNDSIIEIIIYSNKYFH